MQTGGRGAARKGEGRGAAAPAGNARRPDDISSVNRDRLTYCLLGLVSRTLTVKLRGDTVYEGQFHSCDVNGDQSITLKHARKVTDDPSADTAVIPNLIISGKDWLQVTGMDIPPLAEPDEPSQKFATDGEITKGNGQIEQRELVPWSDTSAVPETAGGLGNVKDIQEFDQFEVARRMTGRDSGDFQMEQYTTQLDVKKMDPETRRKADAIAREIEAGTQHSHAEEKLEGGDREGDEEAAFGASQPIVKREEPQEQQAKASGSIPQLPTRELGGASPPHLPGGNRLANDLGGQKQRGMMSEMKRINALNLEPTLPKIDNVRRPFKESNSRSRQSQGAMDLKAEFQQSLERIKGKEAAKAKTPSGAPGSGDATWSASQSQGQSQFAMAPQTSDQGGYPNNGGGDSTKSMSKASSLNPQAKAFSMNPQAGEFTPSGGAAAPAAVSTPQANKPVISMKQFPVLKTKNWETARKDLKELLEPFFQKSKDPMSPQNTVAEWANAKGPPYIQTLGQPRAGTQQPQMTPGPCAGSCAGGWQQRPQGPQGHGPSMNPATAGNSGGAQPSADDWRAKSLQQAQPMTQPGQGVTAGGNQPQMYGQMYMGAGPAQGCGGCMPQQSQQHQQQQQPQQPSQQLPQQQQGPGGFAPQMMMAGCPQQGQMMMVAAGQGGGQCGMNMVNSGAMPKMPGPQQQMMVMQGQGAQGQQQQQMMYVMVAPGQGGCFPQQGFMPQGGCMPGPPQGQGDQSQGQMMQQQMFQQQQRGQG